MNQTETYDIVIIGAGPAGLSCAIEAQRAGMKYLVLDKGGIVSSIQQYQRNMFFFSTPELLEIGGVPFVVSTMRPTSLDCVNYYRTVTDYYKLNLSLYQPVVSSARHNGEFMVKTGRGNQYRSRFIAIATGYYGWPNPLNVRGENLPHVSHFYRDPLPYYHQDILIVGGKNSAVEAALDLWRHGARVTVVHRGPALSTGVKYWILPDFENRVAEGSIRVQYGANIEAFQEGCTLVRNVESEQFEIKTDFAFILIGYRPDVSFLKSFGIDIDADSLAPSHNPETMETNIQNLFVAGGMVGGRFNNKVFIENGREHGKKIVAALKGRG